MRRIRTVIAVIIDSLYLTDLHTRSGRQVLLTNSRGKVIKTGIRSNAASNGVGCRDQREKNRWQV